MQFLCIFFHICRKFEYLISQSSVATCLRWDGYCRMGFAAKSIRFPAVQFFENRLGFDKVTECLKVGTSLRHSADGMKHLLTCRSYRVFVRNVVIWRSTLRWFCTLGPNVFFCIVCVCQVIMKITVLSLTKILIHKRRARQSSFTIHSVQYSIICMVSRH